MIFLLSACIENGLNHEDSDKPASDTGAEDTHPPVDTATTGDDSGTTETADTRGDTAPVDTAADTSPPDTAVVDTGTVDTGEPPPPGPVAVSGYCSSGYPYTTWTDTAATEPELHVVGMYESELGSPGPAYVTVTRTAETVLFLTSYSSVDWQVDLARGTDVTRIVVSSYDVSTVTFLSATTAPVDYSGWVGACGYEYPDMDPTSGCETPDLQLATEAYAGLSWASFQGCYAGGHFTVEG